MAAVDPLVLEMIVRDRQYSTKLAGLERLSAQRLGNIERVSDRMSANMTRSFNRAGAAAATFVGGLVTIGAARELLKIADGAKLLEAQLRLATRESGSFAQAQEDVRRIAMGTRSDLTATAQLYGTFQRNAHELGISQAEAARATETVTQAFRISGATAAEAAGGLRQFLQGVQSGTLRGEELNSVLENAPRLARLLADSLGVTIGQLRTMGQEGELSAQKLMRALTDPKFTDKLEAEFRELPVTFDEAMQQVASAAMLTFGAFDRGGGFSQALANFITDGVDGFERIEKSAEDTGIDIRSTFDGLRDVFDPLLAAAQSVFGDIGHEATSLSQQIRGVLGEIDAITGFVNTYSGWGALTGAYGTNLQDTFDRGQQQSESRRRGALAEQWIRDRFQNVDVMGNPLVEGRPRPVASTGGSKKPKGPSAESLARKEEQERLARIRNEASNAADQARLDDEILAAKAALTTASDDLLQFELQQVEREKERRLEQFKTDVKLGELSEAEFNDRKGALEELARLRQQAIQLQKDEMDSARGVVQRQNALRDEAATLDGDARLARTRAERTDIERRILELSYQEQEAALRQAAANGEIADLSEALRNLQRRRLVDEQILARQNMSPGESYLDELQYEADNLADSYENIAVRGLERMNRAFGENIKSALGLHGVLGDIVSDLIEVALRQQLIRPLAEGLFGGGGGGLGGLFSSIGSIFGRASGGYVGAGQMVRVNEHKGGVELLRMGSQGGTVIPLGAANAQAAQPQAAGGVVRIVVEEADGFASRVRAEATGVAIEVQRAAAPTLINAAVNKTITTITRPKM